MKQSQPKIVVPGLRRDRPLIAIATLAYRPFELDISKLLMELAEARRWKLLDLNLTDFAILPDRMPQGALVNMLPDDQVVRELLEKGCPVVRVGRLPHPEDATVPAVLPDFHEGGRMVGTYFANRGFRDLGIVGHEQAVVTDMILRGLQEAAGLAGCAWHVYRFGNIHLQDSGKLNRSDRFEMRTRELVGWIEALPKPLALLCCQDFMAAQICLMCQRVGLAVPEDVSIMAWGSRRVNYTMAPVPLSSIGNNDEEMMRIAVERLETMMRGRATPPRTWVTPSDIVSRLSTDILAVGSPLVARAIRYIWDHLVENITVDDVAAAMRTPRYRLERAFRKHLQRGVNAELRRVRLERCCHLLRTTNLPLIQLLPQVGFHSQVHLGQSFRKTFGLTPRQYRMRARAADSPADMMLE